MQYMLLIYSNENRSDDGDEEVIKRYGKFTQEVGDAGKLVSADRLKPATAATTVRIRNGETLVTDGPFAETKEILGGFDLIECGSLDEAVEIAAAHPIAEFGTIEVRPLWGK
jgi:hypothetical protein